MLSIIAFIVVIFGSVNWLCIGFFQFDLVAGLFGYQGSIFSRIVYIFIGICAIYVVYSVIKHKGKISVKKLAKQEPLPFGDDKENSKNEQTKNNINSNNYNELNNNNNNNNNNNKENNFNNNTQTNQNNSNYNSNNIANNEN